MTLLSRRNVHILLAVVALTLVLGLLAAFWEYTQDDVFITYAYSRNIALGNGFVFNPGEYVQGTTTPLYALLMAGIYRLTPDLLHVGNGLSALFLLVGCAFAVSLPRRSPSRIGQAALVLTLITSPLIYVSFGMETLFYFALLMASFWLWARQRRVLAILAAAALTWTRADGLVLGATLCLIALWEARKERPIAGVAPWFIFAWLYFGSPLPNTFGAKQEFLQGLKFWTDGWNWWGSFYGNNPLTLLAVPFILIGLLQALRQPALRVLALWAILYTAGYTALNVTAFWYYTALVGVLIVLAVVGGEYAMRQALRTQRIQPYRRVILGLCIGIVVLTSVLSVVRAWDFHAPPERVATYHLLGEWLAAHTPPESSVVVADLGIVGYYAQRRMIDSFGLITPDLTTTREPETAIEKFQPDYVVATQYFFFQRFVHSDWFSAAYSPVVQFSTPRDSFSPMTVYRRLPDAGDSQPSDTPPNQVSLSTEWLPFAHLSGVALPAGDQTWSGGALTVQFDWRALDAAPQDYSLFAHILDAHGVLVAQADGVPTGQPVTGWRAGDVIRDTRRLDLPANLPAGDYTLEIGWYDWRSGKRLTVLDNGADCGDALVLPLTIHNQWPGGSGLP
jgi:hypothetical protein